MVAVVTGAHMPLLWLPLCLCYCSDGAADHRACEGDRRSPGGGPGEGATEEGGGGGEEEAGARAAGAGKAGGGVAAGDGNNVVPAARRVARRSRHDRSTGRGRGGPTLWAEGHSQQEEATQRLRAHDPRRAQTVRAPTAVVTPARVTTTRVTILRPATLQDVLLSYRACHRFEPRSASVDCRREDFCLHWLDRADWT